MRLLIALIAFLLCSHATLGWVLHAGRPKLEVLPLRPTANATHALSFGDPQFLYRAWTLQLQNAGDTGGRFTPMNNYELERVVPWLSLLQALDPLSSFHTFLAVRYFSQVPDLSGLRNLVAFIAVDTALTPERKWFWQAQAVALARDRLKDLPLALRLAKQLGGYGASVPAGYIWVLQMEPIILADLGRNDEARDAIERVLSENQARMTEAEKNWTREFLDGLQ